MENNVAHTTQDVIVSFVSCLEELLDGLQETFPECPKIRTRRLKFRAFVKTPDEIDPVTGQVTRPGSIKRDLAKQLVRDWNKQLGPYYETCERKDMETLLEAKIPLLEELEIRSKWMDPSFDETSRETLWEFIGTLNRFAQLHFVPPKVFQRLKTLAIELESKAGDSENPLQSFNPMALATDMMGEMSAQDIQELTSSLPDLLNFLKQQQKEFNRSKDLLPPALRHQFEESHRLLSNMGLSGSSGLGNLFASLKQ
jgi:hypothetical protein